MSFSQALPVTHKDDVQQALDDFKPTHDLNPVAEALFFAARDAAKEVVRALPTSDKEHLTVQVYGHGYSEPADGHPFSGVTLAINECDAPVPDDEASEVVLPPEAEVTDEEDGA